MSHLERSRDCVPRVGTFAYESMADWACNAIVARSPASKPANLRSGHTRSCSCLDRELARARKLTHGWFGTREYRAWQLMRDRRTNPNNKSWEHYGGCDVSFSPRWRSFENFIADVGPKPEPASAYLLDRYPDPDRHYEKGNVRWATRVQQAANKSRMAQAAKEARRAEIMRDEKETPAVEVTAGVYAGALGWSGGRGKSARHL